MALKSHSPPPRQHLRHSHTLSPTLVGNRKQSETKTKAKEMQVRAERDFTTVCQKFCLRF
jgi:hypothetical protein